MDNNNNICKDYKKICDVIEVVILGVATLCEGMTIYFLYYWSNLYCMCIFLKAATITTNIEGSIVCPGEQLVLTSFGMLQMKKGM